MSMQQTGTAYSVKGLSKGAAIVTFLLGIFMGALDHGIVGPALSSIIAEFQLAPSWGVWSFTIYTLLFAVSISILGKLSDRFGRKQTFMFGIAMFAIGSLISAIAPSFNLFLAGRAIQAIGTGGIFPITAAQIAVTYPPEQRGRMLGMIGVVFGMGTIVGPLLGGLIISWFDWQWIFLINLPISGIILLLMSTLRQPQEIIRKRIDFAGIILLTLTILAIMYGVTSRSISFISLGLILIPMLVWVERKHSDPVLSIRYFIQGKTLILLLASMVSGFVMASVTNLMPLFAETVLGMDRASAGFSVTPLAMASMAASLIGGFMVDRIGAKKVILLGFAVVLIASLVLALGVTKADVFFPVIILMGFGIGIIIGAPLNVLILQVVEMKETGMAIGYLSLFRSLGSTMGPTLAGLFLTMFAEGFRPLFVVSSALSAFTLVLLTSMAGKR